jgi:hypothetical protein
MIFRPAWALIVARFGHGPALAAMLSVASYDFFFVPPVFAFAMVEMQYVITLGVGGDRPVDQRTDEPLADPARLAIRSGGRSSPNDARVRPFVRLPTCPGGERSPTRLTARSLSGRPGRGIALRPRRRARQGSDAATALWVANHGRMPNRLGSPGHDAVCANGRIAAHDRRIGRAVKATRSPTTTSDACSAMPI